MNKRQLEAAIAELKMEYTNLQGDIEKLESTGNADSVHKAEARLATMEERLAELNKQLATVAE
ncbi:SE1832 family protein [Sporosarcina saromensis]|uniref:SE1832 family protein n=1 Tax=Sporosarcina saromensis TaxID=359365 RepID=A0ABU4GC59_9BACL|nr:SE1832 family protein [Sporosarcina saromensis]MDW0113957.1 SE1832 family protein [Sporosarcina saromensis]